MTNAAGPAAYATVDLVDPNAEGEVWIYSSPRLVLSGAS